jgi:hypothetical protein
MSLRKRPGAPSSKRSKTNQIHDQHDRLTTHSAATRSSRRAPADGSRIRCSSARSPPSRNFCLGQLKPTKWVNTRPGIASMGAGAPHYGPDARFLTMQNPFLKSADPTRRWNCYHKPRIRPSDHFPASVRFLVSGPVTPPIPEESAARTPVAGETDEAQSASSRPRSEARCYRFTRYAHFALALRARSSAIQGRSVSNPSPSARRAPWALRANSQRCGACSSTST